MSHVKLGLSLVALLVLPQEISTLSIGVKVKNLTPKKAKPAFACTAVHLFHVFRYDIYFICAVSVVEIKAKEIPRRICFCL